MGSWIGQGSGGMGWCYGCVSCESRFAICFISCICLWQISQIQTCLRVVVGPGFVSTLPGFMGWCYGCVSCESGFVV